MLTHLGYNGLSERHIFLLDLKETLSRWPHVSLPSPLFVCLCVLDAQNLSADEIAAFCEKLLRAGCVYFCAWGPDCERVHDVMDEVIVGENPPKSAFADIMTTWHDDDSLSDALDFFLFDALPYEDSLADRRSGLIITVGNPEWPIEIKRYVSTKVVRPNS
jgi:hypothetical protein